MKPKLITILVLIAMLAVGSTVLAETYPIIGICPFDKDLHYKLGSDGVPEGDPFPGLTINIDGSTVTFNKTVVFCVKAGNYHSGQLTGTGFTVDWDVSGAYPAVASIPDISHVVVYEVIEDVESLTVSKTVVTSFTREHFWDIDKKVETENGEFINDTPKIWLYIDGSGDETATWTVDVTYDRYEDSGWNVSGVITIENTGQLDAVITSVGDVLAGTPINVLCGVSFPYTLLVDATLTCSYSEDGYVEGNNVVTVTTERDSYSATEPIVWGAPTTEINKTVTISDLSDLFGTVALGTVTAPNGDTFTYTKDFAWVDYGQDLCGDYIYDNTATIFETGQYADATLKVNVQCYIYETAYAKGAAAICFIPTFKNWGWTNPTTFGSYTWDLWAGAAQCDTTKGTLVGSVTVAYDAHGPVTVKFNVAAPYLLEETHVYAGYAMFPKDSRGKNTVAPGQYTNASSFGIEPVYVIAHAVVGMPDPNFGP